MKASGTRTVFVVLGAGLLLLLAAYWARSRKDLSLPRVDLVKVPAPRIENNVDLASRSPDLAGIGSSQASPIVEQAHLDPQATFIKLCALYSGSVGTIPDTRQGRFEREQSLHLREARLLALAYPQETTGLAIALSGDSSRPAVEREFACFLLGILTTQKIKAAENQLFGMARSSEPIASAALSYLCAADRDGTYRGLYLAKCQQGSAASISSLEAISRWMDGTAVRVMKEVIQGNPGPEFPASELRGRAEENLRKAEILSAGNAAETLLKILEDPTDPARKWTLWSLDVSRTREVPGILETLRRRLDASEGVARTLDRKLEPTVTGLGGSDPGGFEAQFIAAGRVNSMGDRYFDDLLVAYSEMGGTLIDIERERLRTFGYACDPKDRLRELMRE